MGFAGGMAGGASGGAAGCGAPLDVATTIFVSPIGLPTNSGESPSNPVDSVQVAVARAVALSRPTIALAPGTYSSFVSLQAQHAGLRFVGSRTATFDGDCAPDARSATTLLAPQPTTVSLMGVAGAQVIFSGLTIRSSPPLGLSESTLTVRVTNSNVRFENVDIYAPDARPGRSPAQPGPPGNLACNGTSDCGLGRTGLDGGDGAPADAGSFNAAGYLPGDGKAGLNGDPGGNGTVPPVPPSASCIVACSGATPCIGGELFCGNLVNTVSSNRGTCGCGGRGGIGGSSATGGGASVAVFVTGNTSVVSFQNTRLFAGRGGPGGAPVQGGPGGPGTAGALGSSATCYRAGGPNGCGRMPSMCSQNCEILGPPATVIGVGPAGGSGAPGGPGGRGGAGAGGPSVALVTVGTPSVLIGNSVFAPDAGGEASGGAPPGANLPRLDVP
jgi:hypothetical protein